jgi:hypothetical protein
MKALKYRLLLALPFAGAMVLFALLQVVADQEYLFRVEVLALKLLAAGGTLAAALRLARGDYLRWAWLLTSVCLMLLFAKDLLFGLGWRWLQFPETVAWARGVIGLLANVCGVIGTLLLARAWRVAEIVLPGSRAQRIAVGLAACVLSLLTAGYSTFLDVRGLIGGDPQRLVSVASDLGDIVSLILIAPVMLTAIALRGGLLVWPWALMTMSQLGWLLYDAVGPAGALLSIPRDRLRTFEELFRCIALLAAFGSGLSHTLVMSDLRKMKRAGPKSRPFRGSSKES